MVITYFQIDKLMIILCLISIHHCAVVDAINSHPSFMETKTVNLISSTTTDINNEFTINYDNSYTSISSTFSVSSLDIVPASSIQYYASITSRTTSLTKIRLVLVSTTINLLKVTVFAWDKDQFLFPSTALNIDAIQSHSHTATLLPTTTSPYRYYLYLSRNYYLTTNIKNIAINGLVGQTYGVNYDISVQLQWSYSSTYYGVYTWSEQVQPQKIYVEYLFINGLECSQLKNIYTYDTIISTYGLVRDALTPNLDSSEFQSMGSISHISMQVSQSFEYQLTGVSSTDFYPSDLAYPLESNLFYYLYFSESQCSNPSHLYDKAANQCGTASQLYDIRQITLNGIDSNQELINFHSSPGGKYLFAQTYHEIYMLQFVASNTYELIDTIHLTQSTTNLGFSSDMSYFAVSNFHQITIYGKNDTYQAIKTITVQQKNHNFGNDLIFISKDGKVVIAQSTGGYNYIFNLNEMTGQYQIVNTFEDQYFFSVSEDHRIIFQSGSMMVDRNNNFIYVKQDIGSAKMVASNTKGSLQVQFNDRVITIYEVDLNQQTRSRLQTLRNSFFRDITSQMNLKVAQNSLRFIIYGINLESRGIQIYERPNTRSLFTFKRMIMTAKVFSIYNKGVLYMDENDNTFLCQFEGAPDNLQTLSNARSNLSVIIQPQTTNESIDQQTAQVLKSIEGLSVAVLIILILLVIIVVGLFIYWTKQVKFRPQRSISESSNINRNTTLESNNNMFSQQFANKTPFEMDSQFSSDAKQEQKPKINILQKKYKKRNQYLPEIVDQQTLQKIDMS